MTHGLNNTYLHAAKKVIARWAKEDKTAEWRGTGFFIEKNKEFYFVTNRHMVEPGYSNAEYKDYQVTEFIIESFENVDGAGMPITLKSTSIQNWADFKYHPNQHNDVACLKGPLAVGGMTIIAPIDYPMLATDEWMNQKLSVCDTIAYPGFPEWYDRQNNTPIFRMGTIASDPRLNYSYSPGAPVASRIAYEGFSTGGSSGSPVFSTQNRFKIGKGLSAPDDFYREVRLIGINAGHFSDQAGHSGISFLYKSSAILELIDSM